MSVTIGGLVVRNTAELIDENTKLCMLIMGPPKRGGKTTTSAGLDAITRKYMGKPSLLIACEGAEGGGSMSIQKLGLDFVQPRNLDDVGKIIAGLQSDTRYGGILFDSASDLIQRYIKPMALQMPARAQNVARTKGVPVRDDYQVMGEYGRSVFNSLINLTTHPDLNIRKHLIVTALEKEFTDAAGNLESVKTDLPGQLKDAITAMFNTVARVKSKRVVLKDAKGVNTAVIQYLLTTRDGIADIGDRTHVFPDEYLADLPVIWEKFWIPRVEAIKAAKLAQVAA